MNKSLTPLKSKKRAIYTKTIQYTGRTNECWTMVGYHVEGENWMSIVKLKMFYSQSWNNELWDIFQIFYIGVFSERTGLPQAIG